MRQRKSGIAGEVREKGPVPGLSGRPRSAYRRSIHHSSFRMEASRSMTPCPFTLMVMV